MARKTKTPALCNDCRTPIPDGTSCPSVACAAKRERAKLERDATRDVDGKVISLIVGERAFADNVAKDFATKILASAEAGKHHDAFDAIAWRTEATLETMWRGAMWGAILVHAAEEVGGEKLGLERAIERALRRAKDDLLNLRFASTSTSPIYNCAEAKKGAATVRFTELAGEILGWYAAKRDAAAKLALIDSDPGLSSYVEFECPKCGAGVGVECEPDEPRAPGRPKAFVHAERAVR